MGDPGDGGELTRVNSFQWPAGHVGHLTEGQLKALGQFKKLCQDKGYYTPGDEKSPPTHDEETLLRYLRARKFVPSEAFAQFKDTEDWRKENQLDKLYETIEVSEYDQTRRLYPQWTGRRDKRGIPLYVFEIGAVDAKEVSAYSSAKDRKNQSTNTKVAWKLLKLFALYENLCRFVLPLCSAIPGRPNPETPISQSNNIVDLSGVGFTKLFNLRNHMSDASRLATAHYPETLDRIFVIGAPSFFPTIWSWARGWFDPITVSKIFILSKKDMTSTLEKFVDIEHIPKKYGGKLEWKFGDMPFLDPDIANALQWQDKIEEQGHRTLPKGPLKLEYDSEGRLLVKKIGSENGVSRRNPIASLRVDPAVAALALAPGRVYYNGDGETSETPAATEPPIAAATATKTHPSEPLPMTTPANAKMSDDANLNIGKDPHSSLQPSSRTGAYTVPYSDSTKNIASPPTDGRQGTSSTRFEQQQGTHAEGQLEHGTPATRTEGAAGDRTTVMEPSTVGQAPKEHPGPHTDEAPTMMEQAQALAGQAVEQAKGLSQTVLGAVGMGGQAEEPAVEHVKKEDPAVDNMSGKNVEEFLRSQHASKVGS